MQRAKNVLRATALLAMLIGCASVLGLLRLEPAAAQSPGDQVIYLNQGWSQAERELFYQLPQGSSIASYDIFLNLEVPGSQELFRSDANSARLGLIPQAANPRTNPDGLPVGVTKNVITEGRWKGETASQLRGLPYRAVDVQRQANSHRRWSRQSVRLRWVYSSL